MIGNNSAGARSIVYGQTVDHVRSLTAILSDGTQTTFGPLTPTEYERKLELRTAKATRIAPPIPPCATTRLRSCAGRRRSSER